MRSAPELTGSALQTPPTGWPDSRRARGPQLNRVCPLDAGAPYRLGDDTDPDWQGSADAKLLRP